MRTPLLILFSLLTCIVLGQSSLPATPTQNGFTENKGQMLNEKQQRADDVLFKLSNNGVDVYVTKFGLRYSFLDFDNATPDAINKESKPVGYKRTCVDVILSGANINPSTIVKEGNVTQGRRDFYIGNDNNGFLDVQTFSKITVKNVYAGIDWVLYTNSSPLPLGGRAGDGAFKYDFIVHPGADPHKINLLYKGAGKISGATNTINIETPFGDFEDGGLLCYQNIGNEKNDIRSFYSIKNIGSEFSNEFASEITYGIDNYIKTQDLIIDPQIIWGTSFGSNKITQIFGSDVDLFDNYYITGTTYGTTFPVVNSGTYFSSAVYAATENSFISKFDPNEVLIWSTTYGGTDDFTHALDLKCDHSGNICVVGQVACTDLPVQNAGGFYTSLINKTGTVPAPAPGYSENHDAFILKFDNNGNRLWATYFGGLNYEHCCTLDFDSQDNLIISGETTSADIPKKNSGGYYKGTFFNTRDLFIAKFSNTTALLWSTYYGSFSIVYFPTNGFKPKVAVDLNDNLFVAFSASMDGIPTLNPGGGAYFDNSFSQTSGYKEYNGFIIEFDASDVRVWATYFGDYGNNVGFNYENHNTPVSDIDINSNGDVYIVGMAAHGENGGATLIASPTIVPFMNSGGYYDNTIKTSANTYYSDPYIIKFSNSGVLTWCTFFGGNSDLEEVRGMTIDACDNVHVTGTENNAHGLGLGPLKQGCIGNYYDNTSNYFDLTYLVFDRADNLIYSTLLGGSLFNEGTQGEDVEFDSKKNIYISGYVFSASTGSLISECYNPGGGAYYDDSGVTSAYFGKGYIAKFKPNQLINSINQTNITGCACIGDATVNVCGYPPYNYSWSDGTIQTNSTGTTTLTNKCAGTYKVIVTDAFCQKDSATFIITSTGSAPSITAGPTAATCGSSNGNIVVTVSTGTSPYVYVWSNGVSGGSSISNSTTQQFNNLSAGNYSLTVTDNGGAGCSTTAVVSITNSSAGSATLASSGNILCNGGNTNLIATVTGGTAPYTYFWSNGTSSSTNSPTSQISNLTAQIYSVTITDNNNCSSTSTVNITQPPALSFSPPVITNPACGTITGSASVSASGGTGILNYVWSNSTPGKTILSVAAGTYFVTVADANSCTNTTSVLINSTPSATIDSVKITNSTCKNYNNGSAIAYASAGVGALTYNWSAAGGSGSTVSGLSVGSYVISVVDGSGCLTQSSVMITEPNVISAQSSNENSASCGIANGSADIKAMGGTGSNYTYNWSNGISGITNGQSQISNLTSQVYYCTITDQNSCSYVHTFNIGDSPSPKFSGVNKTAVNCKGNNSGSITVMITSGSALYTYDWGSGAPIVTSAQSNTASNLLAGNHSVTITDNNGCTVDTALTITEPASVFTSTVTSTSATCAVGGSATVSVSGGNVGNYFYTWSNGASSITNNQTSQISNLTAQIYSVTISDSKGCTITSSATINAPAGAPTIQLNTKTDVTCNGKSDGSASVTITGTGTTYTYTWSSGASLITNNQTSQISNLISQVYSLTVTDNNGCSVTTTANITQPSSLSLSLAPTNTTCGNNNGQITAIPTGGNGAYTYLWSTNGTSSQISSLTSQSYSVTITDSKSCTTTSSTTINSTVLPTAVATASATTITTGSSTDLSATGGTSFMWIQDGSLSCSVCQNPTVNPTSTTTYTVIVTDANSCKDTAFVTIKVESLKPCDIPYLPTAFSPNNDGQNDVLYLRGNTLSKIEWSVFDRWGNKVFETNDASGGWDGKFNSEQMDSGVYVYMMKVSCLFNEKQVSMDGNVTLLR